MVKRYVAAIGVGTMVLVPFTSLRAGGQKEQGTVSDGRTRSSRRSARAATAQGEDREGLRPAKDAVGRSAISGAYTNSDESGIPFERPAQFEGKRLEDLTPKNWRHRQAAAGADPSSARRRSARSLARPARCIGSRTTTPPTAARGSSRIRRTATSRRRRRKARRARRRARGRAARRGPADSCEDRSLYDRCITRGIPGSMMPAIYGNSYAIYQGPGYVAIRYEMINETRIIPLDARPHISPKIREYLGDARGHWEGDTLVVETTNFTDKTRLSRVERAPEADRALHAGRARHGRVVGDLRRSADVDAAVDVRDEADQDRRQPGAVRVRVPRRQLRPAQHPDRRSRGRAGDQGSSRKGHRQGAIERRIPTKANADSTPCVSQVGGPRQVAAAPCDRQSLLHEHAGVGTPEKPLLDQGVEYLVSHKSSSRPHRYCTCLRVKSSPGVSRYSPRTNCLQLRISRSCVDFPFASVMVNHHGRHPTAYP